MDTLRFFNPYEEIRFTENLLPHWQQAGAVYFITFRLADGVPAHLLAQWLHPEKAHLDVGEYILYESDLAKQID